MRTTTTTTGEPIDAAAAGQPPLHAALEAFDAWQRRPSSESTEDLRRALGVLVAEHGAHGAIVAIEAPHLPSLELEVGDQIGRTPSLAGSGVPARAITAGDRVVGRLWLDGHRRGDRELVRALGLVIDTTSSRAEVRIVAARLAALDAAVRSIGGVLSVDRVLQLIVDQVRLLVGAHYAALGIVDEAGVIERFITSGMSRQTRARIGDLPRGHGLLGLIIRENRSFRIDDISKDAHSSGFPPHHPAMHSFLGVPVTVKGRSVGNLYLANKRGETPFTEDEQRLVETFSLQAGIAIENARLHDAVQRLAVFDERARIGKDLHDGIIQSLYAVGLSLEDVPALMQEDPDQASVRVDRAIDAINLTIRDIRNFIFGLGPTLLDEADLTSGLAALADETRLDSVLDVDVELPDRSPPMSKERAAELLVITREALSNVARHARATRVTLRLRTTADDLSLSVQDNGIGFEVGLERSPDHHGLRNMRARAEALGGRLEIQSRHNSGTRLAVLVPLQEEDDVD